MDLSAITDPTSSQLIAGRYRLELQLSATERSELWRAADQLAGDAPVGGLAVEALRRVIDDAAAAVVTDPAGREQPMTAIYAVEPLRDVLAAYGTGRDMPIRQVLDDLRPLTVVSIIDQWSASADIDRPEDAGRLGFS